MQTPSTYEYGQNGWDTYQQMQELSGTEQYSLMADYWGNVFDPFIDPEEADFGLTSESVMLGFSPYLNLNIDPGEHYRALEAGQIQEDLASSEFATKIRPGEAAKYGGGGLAVSGYNPQRSIHDIYASDIEDIQQQTEVSISDIYTSFGESLGANLGEISGEGAFSAGGDYLENLEELYSEQIGSQSWYDEDISMQENLEACIENYLSGDPWGEVPTFAEYIPGDANPNAYLYAVNWCQYGEDIT